MARPASGRNAADLQFHLRNTMTESDIDQVTATAQSVVQRLPDPRHSAEKSQGLLLGLVQSGKTIALTAVIAAAADRGFTLFIVLTSDNLWLYDQTVRRLKNHLPRLQVAGKGDWDWAERFMGSNLSSSQGGVVLVATKNSRVLDRLDQLLTRLESVIDTGLPATLMIDDEADQASLDTQARRRAKNPDAAIEPGRINDLITRIRSRLPSHTFLQVTATPQALFLQDSNHPFRPQFTELIEPGQGYVGGSTVFSLLSSESGSLIRHVEQHDVDNLLSHDHTDAINDISRIPDTLVTAVCTFYVASTIKYLRRRSRGNMSSPHYSFLCHISQKKAHHERAFNAIASLVEYLREGLSSINASDHVDRVRVLLQSAYKDLLQTLHGDASEIPTLEEVLDYLANYIVATDWWRQIGKRRNN